MLFNGVLGVVGDKQTPFCAAILSISTTSPALKTVTSLTDHSTKSFLNRTPQVFHCSAQVLASKAVYERGPARALGHIRVEDESSLIGAAVVGGHNVEGSFAGGEAVRGVESAGIGWLEVSIHVFYDTRRL